MRRRFSFIAAILLCLTAVLAGCGTKDAESVVKDLDKTLSSLDSYTGKGEMTLYTGQQPLVYQVEVSYQKPQYYRIALTNAKKDITQIVLRNDEGVFVLTPRLNKVFRFQSDWPANQGQVYLYQTLVQSILLDNSRQFAVDNDAYVFDVMANYQNGSLARQKIWLNKSDYAPNKVEVSDANNAVMVSVKFDSFKFGSKLEKSVFDTQKNMGTPAAGGDQATMASPDNDSNASNANNGANSENAAATTDNSSNAAAQDNANQADNAATNSNADNADNAGNKNGDNPDNNASTNEDNSSGDTSDSSAVTDDSTSASADSTFTGMDAMYLPEGVSEQDSQNIVFGGNPGIMIRYTGTYDYTLIETQPKDVAVSSTKGDLVDMGFTYGSVSGDDQQRTLTWTYEGTEFRITSGTDNLPVDEMVKVAQSVQGEMSK
ncbi:outer membrane lipoprotein carrier protein LolA [Paenibacillus rhizovicinus]|uniref:Outer membrane lipoprotein carrier protein LolA n=1 Tax=Paenibacillus rhizovicinus TaxID=2704463 RepID=A0A6C0P4B2_9BACL|nr:outer membrane lipoprotein carrier protein LolA [Paenibacillus rhizovicinus]QHW33096.1 outer membrane lipoprotein carrier protein LolA [Paenibacillus rhizovicinus]